MTSKLSTVSTLRTLSTLRTVSTLRTLSALRTVWTRSTLWTLGTLRTVALTLALLPGAAACVDDPTPIEPYTDTCAAAKSGQICTFAGTGSQGFDGEGNHRLQSFLYHPNDLGFDLAGAAFLLDWNNHRVRKVGSDDKLTTVIGADEPGDGDPAKDDLKAGAAGTLVKLNHPTDVFFPAIDTPIAKKGTLLLAAWHNHRFRTWDPVTGLVTVTCGTAPGFGGDGAPASKATNFNQPSKLTQDAAGNSYIVDMRNWRIRKAAADGMMSTVAGTGKVGGLTSDAVGLAKEAMFLFFDPAEFSNPSDPGGGLITSADGKTLYIADTGNHRIRAVDIAAGTIVTVAGSGPSGCDGGPCVMDNGFNAGPFLHPFVGAFSGDGGPATVARLNFPHDLALGPDGHLYFADTGNHRVRAIDLKTGIIRTVAGNGVEPVGIKALKDSELGDGKPAIQGRLNRPRGVAFDKAGNLYVADTYNHRIRKIIK